MLAKKAFATMMIATLTAGCAVPTAIPALAAEPNASVSEKADPEDAKAALTEAENNLKEAEANLQAAKENAGYGSTEYQQAKEQQSKAEAAVKKAQADYDAAKEAYDRAAGSQGKTEKVAYDLAKQAHNDAADALKKAEADDDSAKTAYNNAQDAYNTAAAAVKTAKTDAEAEQQSLQKAYDDAAQKVKDQQKAYDLAKNQEDEGSYGFFESVGATAATDVLENCKYHEYIQKPKDNPQDATSLSSMLESLDWIDTCNSLRAKHNLPALKVNDYMMAVAQADADYSNHFQEHARQKNVGENLAWGYRSPWNPNPFEGWYDEEKATYEANPNAEYSTVGHYLNIINADYKCTGFAIQGEQPTHCQTFQEILPRKDGPSYTVQEYRDRLNKYINGAEDTIKSYEQAQKDMADAKAKLDTKEYSDSYNDAVKNEADAKTALDAAQKKLNQADTALATARNTEQTAAKAEAEAKKKYDSATAGSGLASFKAELDKKEVAVKDAQKELDKANASVKKLDDQISADENVKKAEAAYKEAESHSGKSDDQGGSAKIDINDVQFSFNKKKYTYTGKKTQPTITATYNDSDITDYTVAFKKNTKIGTAEAVITGTGNVRGTVTKTFKIVPAKTRIVKIKGAKKSFKVTMKKTSQATGYELRYSTKSSMKSADKKFTKKTVKTVTNLKKGKKYYVQARAYKTVHGQKYFSSWSAKTSVKTR